VVAGWVATPEDVRKVFIIAHLAIVMEQIRTLKETRERECPEDMREEFEKDPEAAIGGYWIQENDMGTTAVVSFQDGEKFYGIHCGDSDYMVIRDGEVVIQSVGHNYKNMFLKKGLEPPPNQEHVVTSALGAKDNGEIFLAASGNDGWGFPFRTCYLHRPPNSSNWDTYQLMTADASATMNGFAMDSNFVHISWERVSGNILMEEIYHCSNFSGEWFNSGIRPDGQTRYGALVIDNYHSGHCLVISGPNVDSQQVYCINSAPLTNLSENKNSDFIKSSIQGVRIFSQSVQLKLPDCDIKEVSIHNINGLLIKRIPVQDNGLVFWNDQAIATGIYVCRYKQYTIPFILVK